MAIDRQQRFLYVIDEVGEFNGRSGGAVCAFSIEQSRFEPVFLNRQLSNGAGPCYLSIDRNAKLAFVGNYFGGSVTVFHIEEDGCLSEPCDFIQYEGSRVNFERQEAPHVHSVVIDEANRYVFAQDLGLARVMVYRLDAEAGKLLSHEHSLVNVEAGSGPRHFVFRPDGRYAYLTRELDSTISVFSYDNTTGVLTELQAVSMLPKNFKGDNLSADLHVAHSGEFLYGSNRGDNSIVVFSIDAKSGKLNYVENKSTLGDTPRSFTIDPTGTFLIAANEGSDTVVTFCIDRLTGRLTPTGNILKIPQPVSLIASAFL